MKSTAELKQELQNVPLVAASLRAEFKGTQNELIINTILSMVEPMLPIIKEVIAFREGRDLEDRAEEAEASLRECRIMVTDCLMQMQDLEDALTAMTENAKAMADSVRDFLHETGAHRPYERRAVTNLAAHNKLMEGK